MSKYNYNKKALKGLTPGPFINQVKVRNEKIEAAPDTIPTSIFNANILAEKLHPAVQHCIISKIENHKGAKSFTLVPDKENGTEKLAYFRAGQYISVTLHADDITTSRPYTIRSSPKDALDPENSSYTITIKETKGNSAANFILNNWAEGSKVDISGPLGEFYHQSLRDAEHVIAIAGGSGITPFYSMAAAIADGIENFDITILYGSRTVDEILLKDEIEAVAARSNSKVKVVHILSDEEAEGFEHGFIDANLIEKYAPSKDFSVFMCGPNALYTFEKGEMQKLKLPKRRYRMEISSIPSDIAELSNFPEDQKGKEYNLTVDIRGEKTELVCKSEETLLCTMEKAGLKPPSHCRSGKCGFCHSKLLKGDVFIPEHVDGRRLADKKFGWVHPCCSYPISDVTLCIYPTM